MEEICNRGVQFKENKSRRCRDKYKWSAGAVVLKLIVLTASWKRCL